ncbi:MAG: cell division protein FtsL [Deltaproteobacteria bacterium]|nr:cell division protein FtsL [Deltaproteobacteria bacterium]
MIDHSLPPTDVAEPVRARGLALPLAFMAVAVVVTAALVGFVRVKSAQLEVGYRIHDLRQELVTLEQQRSALEVERTALLRPNRLAHLAVTELGLVPPAIQTTIMGTIGGTP